MAEMFATIEQAWVREATAAGTDRLARLVSRATLDADLAASDVYSLGDWIEPLDRVEAADNLGLLLVALFLAVGEGSLAIRLDAFSLKKRLDGMADDAELEAWLSAALADERAGCFDHVIGDGRNTGVDNRPLLKWTDGARRFLYFQKHFRAEEELVAKLAERAERPQRVIDDQTVCRAIGEVLDDRPLMPHGIPVRWDEDQLAALGLALLRKFVVISGGPGTGKTTVVLTLLRTLARLGVRPERIALAAPTGRAAQRLSDSLRGGLDSLGNGASDIDQSLQSLSAVTLHALLEYNPSRAIYRRHEENPIPADVVVIDEVSMVGVEHLAALLRALEPGAQLILLGDKDQLPSVDAGAVLGQLVPAEIGFSQSTQQRIKTWLPQAAMPAMKEGGATWLPDAAVILRTNHRSEPGVRAAADAINRQDQSLLATLPRFDGNLDLAREGCWWWPQPAATPGELRGQILAWAKDVYEAPLPGGSLLEIVHEQSLPATEIASSPTGDWLMRIFQRLDRARLLTLVREGPWGCGPINDAILLWLQKRSAEFLGKPPSRPLARELTLGTPILVTQNDKVRGLYNGDVGLAVRGENGLPRIVFARRGGFLSFTPASLPSHELGFALTVHKSQGSEFERALVVLPPTGARRLLTKELLYTAVTRAKKLAIISATEESLRAAIGRRIVRETGRMQINSEQ